MGRSTIGAAALNGRVRDGIGCFARAVATKPAKRTQPRRRGLIGARRIGMRTRDAASADLSAGAGLSRQLNSGSHDFRSAADCSGGGPVRRKASPLTEARLPLDRNQACRAISTGQLNASPRLHLRPIDVVVCHGPQGRPGFEGGFPLRCLQRLSCPHIATLHCRGRDNRSTSGAFTPVLSY